MSNLFAKVGGVIASIGLAIGGFFGYVPEPEIAYVPEAVYVPQEEVYAPEEETLGADAVLPVAGVTYYLAGTGISSSATSFTLTSFTVTQNGKKIQDSEMSETFYFTLEPGSRSRQEIVACTTVVQNADNTATISGCTRGMAPVTPYTASTSLQFAHAGGSIAILSNPPQLYNQVAIKDNDETVTGLWDFPTPVSGNNPATKDYVLSVVTGGAVTIDATIIGGVAGETFATGTIVYLNPTDARWYKADADLESTFADRQLGIAQSSGSAGNSVLAGVLIYGTDDSTQSAMTPGGILWLSATAGATSSATTTQALGTVVDATTLIFNPSVVQSTVGKQTTFTASTSFTGINAFYGTTTGIGKVSVYKTNTPTTTATYTFNKATSTKFIEVLLIGGGGSGGGGSIDTSSTFATGGLGGGGGGISKQIFNASDISGAVTVTVGAGAIRGAGKASGSQGNGADGTSGGSSSFGSYLIATGGTGGLNNTGVVGAGGTGNLISGTAGGDGGRDGTADAQPGVDTVYMAATGGGGGETYTQGTTGGRGGNQSTTFVASGGAGVAYGNGGNGTNSSQFSIGGTGGAGGGEVPGSGVVGRNGGNGGFYGGGGGGGGISIDTGYKGGDGGDGGPGIVVVIEY